MYVIKIPCHLLDLGVNHQNKTLSVHFRGLRLAAGKNAHQNVNDSLTLT